MKHKGPPPGILKYPSSRFGPHGPSPTGTGTGTGTAPGGAKPVPLALPVGVAVPVGVVPVPGPPCSASVPLCAGPPGFCHAGLSPSRCPQHGGCGVHPMLPGAGQAARPGQPPPGAAFFRPPTATHQQRIYQMPPGYGEPLPMGLPPVGPRVAPHSAASDKKSSFVILADGSVIETSGGGSTSPFRGRGFRRDASPSTSRSRSRSISPATRSSTSSFATRRHPVTGSGSSVSPGRRPYMEHALTAGRGTVNQLAAVFENKSASLPRVRSSRRDSLLRRQSSEETDGRVYATTPRSPHQRAYNGRDLSPIPQRAYGPARDPSPERRFGGYSPSRNTFSYTTPRDKSPGRRKYIQNAPKERSPGRRDGSPVYRRPSLRDPSPRRKTPPRDYSPIRDQEMSSRRDASPGNRKNSRSRDPSPNGARKGCETCRSREASPARRPGEMRSREGSPSRSHGRDSSPGKRSSSRPSSRGASPSRSTRTSWDAASSRSRDTSPRMPARSREPSPARARGGTRSGDHSPMRTRDPSPRRNLERSRSRESSPLRKGEPSDDSDSLKKSASVPRLNRSRSPSLTRTAKSATRKSTPSLIPVAISRLPSMTSLSPSMMSEQNTDISEPTTPMTIMSPTLVGTPRRHSIYEPKSSRVPVSRPMAPKSRGSPTAKRAIVSVRQKTPQGKSAPSSPKPNRKGAPDHHKSQPTLSHLRPVKKSAILSTEPVSPSKIPLSQNASPMKKKDYLTPAWKGNPKMKSRRNSPSPAKRAVANGTSSKALPAKASDQNTPKSSNAKTNSRSVPYRLLKQKDSQPSLVRRPTNSSIQSKMKPDRSTLEKLGSGAVNSVSSMANKAGAGSGPAKKVKESSSTNSLLASKTTEAPKPDVPTSLPPQAASQEYTVDPQATESSSLPPALASAMTEHLLDSTNEGSEQPAPILASLVGGVNNVSEPSSTLVTSTAAAPIELAQPEVAQPAAATANGDHANGDHANGDHANGDPSKRAAHESSKVPDPSPPDLAASPPEMPMPATETDAGASTSHKEAAPHKTALQTERATGSPPKKGEPAAASSSKAGTSESSTNKDTVRGEPDIEVLNANKLPQDAGGRRNAWTENSGSGGGGGGQKKGRGRSCLRFCRRPDWCRPRNTMRAKKGLIERLACWRRVQPTRASAEALTATAAEVAAAAKAPKVPDDAPRGCLSRMRAACGSCARRSRKKPGKVEATTAATAASKAAAAAAAAAPSTSPAKPAGRFRRGCMRCGSLLTACCGALFCLRTACCMRSGCRQPGGCCARCCPLPDDSDGDGADGRRRSQTKQLSRGKSMTASNPELGKLDAVLVEHNGMMRSAIPVLPLPLAWVCLVFNVFVPGLGTLSMGLFCLCVGKARFSTADTVKSRVGAFCVDVMVSATQLFTVLFCLVGWGWSIWWGVIALRLARKYKRIRMAERAAAMTPEGPINVPPPPFAGVADVERGSTPKPP